MLYELFYYLNNSPICGNNDSFVNKYTLQLASEIILCVFK